MPTKIISGAEKNRGNFFMNAVWKRIIAAGTISSLGVIGSGLSLSPVADATQVQGPFTSWRLSRRSISNVMEPCTPFNPPRCSMI